MALLFILTSMAGLLIWLYHRQSPLESILVEEELSLPSTVQQKGREGEQEIQGILQKLPGEFLLYNNLYIPISTDKWTEIDLVIVHEKGIFVFESKNYTGLVEGEAHEQQWSKTYSESYNQKFYNPIKQNNTHMNALRQILGEVPMYSIIVFGHDTELQVDPMPADDVFVCKITQLYFLWDLLPTLNYEVDILAIQNKLQQLEKADWTIQQNHIDRVSKIGNKAIS
ncbi:MAG: NERD domain-containing protein [Kurthia sp.]|nr:NERD domain-containing protein [Candidatus Kurthia equi]